MGLSLLAEQVRQLGDVGREFACYLPESCGSCCGLEAEFCCAASVLPDDTCADAASQVSTAAKKANSRRVLTYALLSRRTDLNLPAFF